MKHIARIALMGALGLALGWIMAAQAPPVLPPIPITTKKVQTSNLDSSSTRELESLDNSIAKATTSLAKLHEHALKLATIQLIVVIVSGIAGMASMLAIALVNFLGERRFVPYLGCDSPSESEQE